MNGIEMKEECGPFCEKEKKKRKKKSPGKLRST
jgi:hypothetical protein